MTGRRPLVAAVAALGIVIVTAAATHRHRPIDILAAVVLALAAPFATYGLARRVGGSAFQTAATVVYALLPLLGILYALRTYRHTFVHDALPQLVGLQRPQLLALGVAVAAVLAFVPERVGAGLGFVAFAAALVTWRGHGLGDVRNGFHETGWSPLLAGWVFLAGVVAVAIRRPWAALAIGGWSGAVVLRAAHGGYGDHADFWRALAPATPALAVLVSSLGLLAVPLWRGRRAPAASEAH